VVASTALPKTVLPRCPAVLKEALRRYSVVPVVTRSLKEDDMLGGQPVPAGAMIVCHIQVRLVPTLHIAGIELPWLLPGRWTNLPSAVWNARKWHAELVYRWLTDVGFVPAGCAQPVVQPY
jgi:hypothetical protein